MTTSTFSDGHETTPHADRAGFPLGGPADSAVMEESDSRADERRRSYGLDRKPSLSEAELPNYHQQQQQPRVPSVLPATHGFPAPAMPQGQGRIVRRYNDRAMILALMGLYTAFSGFIFFTSFFHTSDPDPLTTAQLVYEISIDGFIFVLNIFGCISFFKSKAPLMKIYIVLYLVYLVGCVVDIVLVQVAPLRQAEKDALAHMSQQDASPENQNADKVNAARNPTEADVKKYKLIEELVAFLVRFLYLLIIHRGYKSLASNKVTAGFEPNKSVTEPTSMNSGTGIQAV